MSAIDKVIGYVREALKDPANQKKLAAAFGTAAAKLAKSNLSKQRKERGQRALAEELARQTKDARISYRTILGDGLYTVVWVEGAPYQAFPPYNGDLNEALKSFNTDLLRMPPAQRAKVWERDWWAPPGKFRVTEAGWWAPPEGHKIWQSEWWQKDRPSGDRHAGDRNTEPTNGSRGR